MSVAIILADGVEEIELIAVWDILKRAQIETTAYSIASKLVIKGGQNIGLLADKFIDTEEIKNSCDYLFLPGGGVGTQNLKDSPEVLELVQHFKANKPGLFAICAAPTVLEKAGVVGDLEVTSYPAVKESFANYSTEKIVKSGNIITSQGVGTALEFAIALVEEIKGKEVAEEVAKATLIR